MCRYSLITKQTTPFSNIQFQSDRWSKVLYDVLLRFSWMYHLLSAWLLAGEVPQHQRLGLHGHLCQHSAAETPKIFYCSKISVLRPPMGLSKVVLIGTCFYHFGYFMCKSIIQDRRKVVSIESWSESRSLGNVPLCGHSSARLLRRGSFSYGVGISTVMWHLPTHF